MREEHRLDPRARELADEEVDHRELAPVVDDAIELPAELLAKPDRRDARELGPVCGRPMEDQDRGADREDVAAGELLRGDPPVVDQRAVLAPEIDDRDPAAGDLEQGVLPRGGIACYPRDGRTPDELMARAEASARGLTPAERAPRGDLVAGRTMQDLYAIAARVAHGTISVLILGETGVGKEVLAEQVHRLSPRADKPYLRLNCAALSESLLESELFGHERGAFTGAVGAKPELLETADGGSVFLDEVGELPLAIQVKLLRVIEERVTRRVGGLKPRPLDVRFIAATNRDLEAEIACGTFRQDLYFRLNGATLVIPPLRECPAEIPGLARSFLASATRRGGLARIPELSADALDALLRYSWPGNIRELRNVIERAVLLCGDGQIHPRHLPLEKMRVTFATAAASAPAARPPLLRRGPRLSADQERAQVEAALLACGGNQTRAAQMLGIGRRTLINRVKEFGLARPRGK